VLTLPGGIRIQVNRYIEPDAMYAMPLRLTEDEKRDIKDAGDAAQAAGQDRKRAEFEALCKTGKIVKIILGSKAAADLAVKAEQL
jgi:hypothetical protein